MGRRKAVHTESETPADGAAPKASSKRDAVRQALTGLGNDAKPSAIRDFIQSQFGLEMGLNLISNYKNGLTKKASGQSGVIRTGKRLGRPPASEKRQASVISMEDIEAIKALKEKIGFEQLKSIISLFGK